MKKKLFLNKQTITKLNDAEKQQIKGGDTFNDCDQDFTQSCDTFCHTEWPDCHTYTGSYVDETCIGCPTGG